MGRLQYADFIELNEDVRLTKNQELERRVAVKCQLTELLTTVGADWLAKDKLSTRHAVGAAVDGEGKFKV